MSRIAAERNDPESIRRKLLDDLRDIARADSAGFYNVADVDGSPHVADWLFIGDAAGERAIRDVWSAPQLLVTFVKQRFLHPKTPERRRFLESSASFEPNFRQSEFYRRIFAPHGIEDQIRMLVYDGDLFIGWIGALRLTTAFTSSDRRRLAPHCERFRQALIEADRREREIGPREPGCIIVRSDATVEFADEGGRRWLAARIPAALLREGMKTFLGDSKPEVAFAMGGAEVRATRVHSADVVRWVMRLSPVVPLRSAPDSALSPVQRQVAESAAAGATIVEIATALGRSPETIRTHLRQAYVRLGVSSRVELNRALQQKRS